MKGAAQRWTIASLAGLSLLAVAAGAEAQREKPKVEVTNADRVWANYIREAATVEQNKFRIEVRAFRVEDNEDGGDPDCRGPLRKNCTRLNTIGQRVIGVEDIRGATFDLIGSYGVAKNAEVGLKIQGIIESFKRDDGSSTTFEDVGDIVVYGKFVQEVAANCVLGGGLELSTPPWNGLAEKARTVRTGAGFDAEGSRTGTSTGELGLNPFISSRYQVGRIAVGAHIGYNFYTDDDVEEVLNYSAHTILRGSDFYALRLELNGRLWDQFGEKWHDIALLPGVDLPLADNVTFRPTGLVNLTNTALDWGIGAGVAATF